MIFKRVDHVELVPKDPHITIGFFVNILGFKIKNRTKVDLPPMEEVIFLELGDTVVEIISAKEPEQVSEAPWQVGYRALALEVEDMSKAVNYLKAKGIPMAVDPVDLGGSYRAEIRDPNGLIIELRQWK
ncbi:VOC family protein [uncultured Shewanella sp.]|uniref:VOC family protein n=1 Tax=uncultured Shewanella sp. TaxID=173975 RepID=UPI0026292F82|nr:VOC family protein [uncultured Shewanella sp.]